MSVQHIFKQVMTS